MAIAAGLALARSRAGVFLAMAALVGVALLVLTHRRSLDTITRDAQLQMRRITIGAVGFAGLFAALFGLERVLSRFDRDPFEDLRLPFSTTTLETALNSLPFGTGIGSFVPIYAIAEKSADVFTGYANRAHNDFAEFFLEAGIPALILMFAFLTWFAHATYRAWFQPSEDLKDKDVALSRAATLIIALLLAHCLVDYPLRTTALASVFAFCAAVMVPPRLAADALEVATDVSPSDDINATGFGPSVLNSEVSLAAPLKTMPKRERAREIRAEPLAEEPFSRRPKKRWGEDVDWPEAWKTPDRKN